MTRRRGFGSVDLRASGRWRARYTHQGRVYGAPFTFDTIADAAAFLAATQTDITRGKWVDPDAPSPTDPETFANYAAQWVSERHLATTTREHYQSLLRLHLDPTFGAQLLSEITAARVRSWYARPGVGPTVRAHAYGLLRSVLGTALRDGLIDRNPCTIRGGGSAPVVKEIRPLTPPELARLVAAMPAKVAALPLLLGWCSLRFGEATGLQRADVDLDAAIVHVRRGVVRTRDGLEVKSPKTKASRRRVAVPANIIEPLRRHLDEHSQPGPTGWVFPSTTGGPLCSSSFRTALDRAAAEIGRPDLTPHQLRHAGQSWAAASGANLRELMGRAGQSTPGAALRYIHELDGRQREIAARLSEMAEGT